MSAVPLAIPFAWSTRGCFYLLGVKFRVEIGSDCLRIRELIG
jgi:hypothetical protein